MENTMDKKIGSTQMEIDAGQILECRKIVKNILQFGVTEQQKIQLIKLLVYELESQDAIDILLPAINKIYELDHSVKFSLNKSQSLYNKEKPKLLDI
jgi:hypothetical protein